MSFFPFLLVEIPVVFVSNDSSNEVGTQTLASSSFIILVIRQRKSRYLISFECVKSHIDPVCVYFPLMVSSLMLYMTLTTVSQ